MKTVLAALLAFAPALKSDPVGVYAVIERVVFEPKEGKPERVQIWGAFCLAKGRNGNEYEAPVRGYLYFSLDDKKTEDCRAEWVDLESVASKNQGVAFGTRYAPVPRLRPATEKAAQPDVYRLGWGVGKTEGGRVGLIKLLPAPSHPADGAEVAAGPAQLVVRNHSNASRQGAEYVFEIENAGGDKETSKPVPPGVQETAWTSARIVVKAGEKYTWRVWVVDKDLKGPVATFTFTGKK